MTVIEDPDLEEIFMVKRTVKYALVVNTARGEKEIAYANNYDISKDIAVAVSNKIGAIVRIVDLSTKKKESEKKLYDMMRQYKVSPR